MGNTFIDLRLSGVSRIGSRKRACRHQLQHRRLLGNYRPTPPGDSLRPCLV